MAKGLTGWIMNKIGASLVKAGMKLEEAFAFVGKVVPGLNRSRFAGMYRTAEARAAAEGMPSLVNPNAIYPTTRMIESDAPHGRRYLVNFDVSGYNRLSGEPQTIRMHAYFDDRWSENNFESIFLNQLQENYQRYEFQPESARLVSVEHKRGWSY